MGAGTAGMDEDTQRGLFLEEERSIKELGAHAGEIPPALREKTHAGK